MSLELVGIVNKVSFLSVECRCVAKKTIFDYFFTQLRRHDNFLRKILNHAPFRNEFSLVVRRHIERKIINFEITRAQTL